LPAGGAVHTHASNHRNISRIIAPPPAAFSHVNYFYMQILIVHAHIKSEFIEAFKAATIINAESSSKEPGIASFELLQQQDDPSRFVLVEVYRDADAPAKHKASAHYNAWIETVNDMFVTPRTRAFYNKIAPSDAA
jgi:autoinducer 2-degrading protein